MKDSKRIVMALIVACGVGTSTMLASSPRDGARGAAARLAWTNAPARAIDPQSRTAAYDFESTSRTQRQLPVEFALRRAVSPAGVWSVSDRSTTLPRSWIGNLARLHGQRVDGRYTRQRWEHELVQRILSRLAAGRQTVASS